MKEIIATLVGIILINVLWLAAIAATVVVVVKALT